VLTRLAPCLRLLRSYWSIVVLVAAMVAAWVYYQSTRPFLDCPTGHCPDPGSTEYLWIVQKNIDRAPWTSLFVFALGLAIGGVIRVLVLALRALRRRLSP
jgi:hypothetical protein